MEEYMGDEITVLGETFQQAVGKTVGPDYKSCGNTYWPNRKFFEMARSHYSQPMRGRDEDRSYLSTAADYEFQEQKGFILGPPQPCKAGSREEMIRQGYAGVYYKQPAPG